MTEVITSRPRECSVAVRDPVAASDVAEVVITAHTPPCSSSTTRRRTGQSILAIGFEVMNWEPSAGLPNTKSVDGLSPDVLARLVLHDAIACGLNRSTRKMTPATRECSDVSLIPPSGVLDPLRDFSFAANIRKFRIDIEKIGLVCPFIPISDRFYYDPGEIMKKRVHGCSANTPACGQARDNESVDSGGLQLEGEVVL